MILASIDIENYKQYAGSHLIEFPEQGLVAITGPNGAGKTTLFEAIEWCLYGPRTIPLGDIPPHGGVGHTRVTLTLQDALDGRRYVVLRNLRNGATSAEVYAEDDPGQPLVQGPRDVTQYVARTLIGLPHAAFVSTFFTRQKELTFFGDREPGRRRAEVARLLGFQTIRDAHEEMSQERNEARREADGRRIQYEREIAGRDLDADIAAAEMKLNDAEVRSAATEDSLRIADQTYARSRADLDHWRSLQECDAEHERALLAIVGDVQAAMIRRAAADAELHRLERLRTERMTLDMEAAQVAGLTAAVAAMEIERERARRLDAARQAKRSHDARLREAAKLLRELVLQHQGVADGIADWRWNEDDERDPCQTASRLMLVIAAVDHQGARQLAEAMKRTHELATRAAASGQKLEKLQRFRIDLERQRAELIGGQNPAERLQLAEAARSRSQQALEASLDALTKATQDRIESEELERIFDARSANRVCPTCSRTLSDNEAARLLETLRGATAQRREEERLQQGRVKDARAFVAASDAERSRALDLVQKASAFDDRLADGARMIADAEAEHDREGGALRLALEGLQRKSAPSMDEIEAAHAASEKASKLASLAGAVEQIGHRAVVDRDAAAEAEREAVELGVVDYDAQAHAELQSQLDAARQAAAHIKRIDIELGQESGYQKTSRDAERELGGLEQRRREIESARLAVAFNPDALQGARTAELEAGKAQQIAREEAAAAREAYRDAQAALRWLVEEQDKLRRLAEEAGRRGREADELDRMYREFGEFDKYVADHVGPLLAETTERLLSLVTNAKYDRVRFDENYGIEVFDGDECFKLESFSGGERDVVALCARLAMSELVGSSAVRPPRFLVLDEVFGSLDSERRAQLLETLGALASGGYFQQMFIISHVDDVQLSPVMNEAWTIQERDGVSRVQRPELSALT